MKKERLDCPYDFTSRCTMGRCDCKPKEEIMYSEEDIEKAFKVGFTLGDVEANDEKDKYFNIWFKIFKKK